MLKSSPTQKHLSRMYYELSQLGAACSGEKSPWPYHPQSPEELLVLGAEMSRYDPRLLGILVEYFLKNWKTFSPQKIRDHYLQMHCPQTLAVIAEFSKHALRKPELSYFVEYLQRGLKPVATQLYFKDLYSPGGKLMQRASVESLAQYKKWGFLAREAPTIDVYQKKTVGHLDRDGRLGRLHQLFTEKKEIRLSDYLTALHHSISRQQALKDLEAVATLKRGTRGRGAKWGLRSGK